MAAENFWWARSSLTQRAIGPISTATVVLDGSGLELGDVAGLALLGMPWRWIGIERGKSGFAVSAFDYQTGERFSAPIAGSRLWLRAHCNFLTEEAQFSYSTDGVHFEPLGQTMIMIFQLKTFQGIRYALFTYNQNWVEKVALRTLMGSPSTNRIPQD
jgi:hypothetical protein